MSTKDLGAMGVDLRSEWQAMVAAMTKSAAAFEAAGFSDSNRLTLDDLPALSTARLVGQPEVACAIGAMLEKLGRYARQVADAYPAKSPEHVTMAMFMTRMEPALRALVESIEQWNSAVKATMPKHGGN